jgi:hypothetical protein
MRYRGAIAGMLVVSALSATPGLALPFGRPMYMAPEPGGIYGIYEMGTDGAGTWIVFPLIAYPQTVAYLLRSADDGATWATIDAGPLAFSLSGMAIAGSAGGTWIASRTQAVLNRPHPFVSRSTDSGVTWGPLVRISATDQQTGFVDRIATDGNGTWLATWVDELVYVARSADDGVTWESQTLVSAPDAYSLVPRLATDGAGMWVVAFQTFEDLGGTIGVDYDLLFARSTDDGLTWSPRAVLNTTAYGDAVADHDVDLAADGDTWIATWIAGEDVVVARSVDDGVTWGAPVTISGASGPNRAFPSIATNGSSNWIVTWSESDGGDGDVLEARSSDGGVTWGAPACLSPGCAYDAYLSGGSFVRARTGGGWLATWVTRIGGVEGGVNQLVVARSAVACTTDAECRPCEVCTGGGTCEIGARSGCRGSTGPGKGILMLRDRETGSKDSVSWKLTKGEATSLGDFGDPTATDDYTLCLFDESVPAADLLFVADLPAGGTCGLSPCWRQASTGYTYGDGSKPTATGVRKLQLRGGADGGAKFVLKGKGEFLQERLLGLPVPPLPTPLRVQLQAANGTCWEAAFSSAQRNAPGLFKARAD